MPRILGTGLIALDLIVEHYAHRDQELLVGGGGTCGNVLSILARTGWESSLIGALDDSVWSQIMRSDLECAGVQTQWLRCEPSVRPSLIVEHLQRSGEGAGRHWFSFVCPRCQKDWPGPKVAPDNALRVDAKTMAGKDVFYVDRLSQAVIDLARMAKQQGSIVVYEPSSKGDRWWLKDMLVLADIVKYSDERADALALDVDQIDASLVLVTEGAQGSSWRLGGKSGTWRQQSAHRTSSVVDTCGAGDWFTAALLHGLVGPMPTSAVLSEDHVARAIDAASAVAAWSCGFVGARGALYDATSREFIKQMRPLAPTQGGYPVSGPLKRPVLPDPQCHDIELSIC